MFIGKTDAEAETLILWPPDAKNQLIGKDPDEKGDEKQRKRIGRGKVRRLDSVPSTIIYTYLHDHLMQKTDSLEKILMLGKIEGQEEKGTTEDEMVGRHHRLNGHEFEYTPGVGDGQGSLECYSPWDHKESDTSE